MCPVGTLYRCATVPDSHRIPCSSDTCCVLELRLTRGEPYTKRSRCYRPDPKTGISVPQVRSWTPESLGSRHLSGVCMIRPISPSAMASPTVVASVVPSRALGPPHRKAGTWCTGREGRTQTYDRSRHDPGHDRCARSPFSCRHHAEEGH